VRGDRTPLMNGLLYGSAAGLFGGSLWAFFTNLPPDEALIAPRWIIVTGGIGFCFLAGFLVGAFSGPPSSSDKDELHIGQASLLGRGLTAVGWLLYRLLVGYFVGLVVAVVFCLIGISPWFAILVLLIDPDKRLLDRPETQLLLGALMGGLPSSFSGGVFGALLVSRRSIAARSTLGWRAVRGSFLGFLCGILFGAAFGWWPQQQANDSDNPIGPIVYFVASVPIGILSGILGGLWTDIRKMGDSPEE
jgi:hypothetical protein